MTQIATTRRHCFPAVQGLPTAQPSPSRAGQKKFNAFDNAAVIHNSYAFSFVYPIIASGFVKTGIWDNERKRTNVNALSCVFVDKTASSETRLSSLLSQFMARNRSLSRDNAVEQEGRIMINTQTSAHITSHVVLEAFKER